MGEICKKARQVLIWLGEKDYGGENTAKASSAWICSRVEVAERQGS